MADLAWNYPPNLLDDMKEKQEFLAKYNLLRAQLRLLATAYHNGICYPKTGTFEVCHFDICKEIVKTLEMTKL